MRVGGEQGDETIAASLTIRDEDILRVGRCTVGVSALYYVPSVACGSEVASTRSRHLSGLVQDEDWSGQVGNSIGVVLPLSTVQL